jgi:histidinol phosphatase-like enzyme (inositol monophosphatase family)
VSLLEAVTEVARIAGDTANRFFGKGLAVETKADGSPVTQADRAAEAAARAWIEARFPEDGILGEELGVTRPEARRRWILDPIDGTKSFVRGVPLWGSLVAVVEGDVVLAGAVYIAAQQEMVAAAPGEGCFWNGARAKVSSVSSLREAVVLTTDLATPVGWGTPEGARSAIGQLASRGAVARTWGDCYGYVLVATGRAEAMVDPVLSLWDSAALQPIVEEAGGVFTDVRGIRTGLGGSAIATNAALAKEVRALFQSPSPPEVAFDPASLNFEKGAGLVAVVTQDARSGEVLMMAYADREAVDRTVVTGLMHYRSRTRGLWKKGETSGNMQRVVSLHADCDRDTILARVVPYGPACHTGDRTCFHDAPAPCALTALDRTIAARKENPTGYTGKLLADRNLRLKKIGEEATELAVALADGDSIRAREEGADLFYHALVGLRAAGVGLDDVREVLAQRAVGTKPLR